MKKQRMNDVEVAMLQQAAIAYRGFGIHNENRIADLLDPWLGPALLGPWQRVWGPASYRAPGSLVDDALMYVATSPIPRGKRYVVSIRGTNPVSPFDWIFGDMWVQKKVPWPQAATGSVSASTWLGLEILKNLRSDIRSLSRFGNFGEVGALLGSALQSFARRLPELLPADVLGGNPPVTSANLLDRTEHLLALRSGDAKGEVLKLLRLHLAPSGLLPGLDPLDEVFRLLLQEIRAYGGSGSTASEFLAATAKAGDEVWVTGHSKGGALSLVFALWLVENWAARAGIPVRVFAFAGPTAGDSDFAAHYSAVLGGATRRVVNSNDIVPQGWVPKQLSGIGTTYPDFSIPLNAVAELVQSLGYAHVDSDVTTFAGPRQKGIGEGLEIVWQHLNAYLRAAKLPAARWTAERIFLTP